jgi:hypothetical protein
LDVFAFDVAEIAQSLTKPFQRGAGWRLARYQNTDPRNSLGFLSVGKNAQPKEQSAKHIGNEFVFLPADPPLFLAEPWCYCHLLTRSALAKTLGGILNIFAGSTGLTTGFRLRMVRHGSPQVWI